ncbi:hypothetical protein [Pseudoruegeria sp. HB172150]|uniref:hypothetical protein n=1 Tax=Pseudoruegeria sp. HB172150 TaxID=2721164 RepID=UPI0015516D81|nr:hypothetical protein [Pseudoruegeria sp. HB172150]
MKTHIPLLAGAVLATAALPALAETVKGSTTIETRRGTISHAFVTEIDPGSGVITRAGTLVFPGGDTGSYQLVAQCDPDRRSCGLTGSGTGPRGIGFTGSGQVSFTDTGTRLTGELVSEKGRTVRIDRQVDRTSWPELDMLGLLP